MQDDSSTKNFAELIETDPYIFRFCVLRYSIIMEESKDERNEAERHPYYKAIL